MDVFDLPRPLASWSCSSTDWATTCSCNAAATPLPEGAPRDSASRRLRVPHDDGHLDGQLRHRTAAGRTRARGYAGAGPAVGPLVNELVGGRPDPRSWQPHGTVFEAAVNAGVEVTMVGPRYFEGSGLTTAALRGARFTAARLLDERVTAAVAAVRATPRALVYLYWGGRRQGRSRPRLPVLAVGGRGRVGRRGARHWSAGCPTTPRRHHGRPRHG